MSECEVCGYDGAPFLAEIEGAQMKVCKHCLSLGTEVKQPKLIATIKRVSSASKEPVMIAEFADAIMAARQTKGYSRETFAATLGEKVNIITRIENGRLQPDMKLARKMEKLLQISLFEMEEEVKMNLSVKGDKVTLGDIAEIKSA